MELEEQKVMSVKQDDSFLVTLDFKATDKTLSETMAVKWKHIIENKTKLQLLCTLAEIKNCVRTYQFILLNLKEYKPSLGYRIIF